MLVNAQAYPWPALFQGVGLIAVSIWAVWLFGRPAPTREDVLRKMQKEFEERQRELRREQINEHNRRVQGL